MKLWLLMFHLLLLAILSIHEVQGIRLKKGYISHKKHHHIHVNSIDEVALCKGKHCAGRNRKLAMNSYNSISSTNTITTEYDHKEFLNKANPKPVSSSDTLKSEKKEEKMHVMSSKSEPTQEAPYPDILDIAGMDYSQARRKSPIHN